ncbi:ABC transporter permease subunit [Bradyrhizobium sp. dw_411]|uniref:ABC transporter permease n=1 Tax=Bradyrhizobium sp. dw_411 TaxID=2720082 RepID=UPI001BD09DE3|nr:ABC transporter permease subunit [Bradyrhizobium sp. dw_411]
MQLSMTFTRVWRPAAVIITVLAATEILQRTGIGPVYIPAPSSVLEKAISSRAILLENLGPTAGRAGLGFLIAAVATFTAASLAAVFRPLYGVIYNTGAALHSLPIIATAPLLALWIGTGAQLQVTLAAMACQFPILVGTIQGLGSADAQQRELLIVLSASRAQTLRHLLVPSALPYIFAGLKVAAPSAVLGTVTAEWAGSERGIGAMMLYALFAYDTATVWLSVIATCLLSAAGFGFWALVEKLTDRTIDETEIAN